MKANVPRRDHTEECLHGSQQLEESDVVDYLRQTLLEEFDYLPNPGNAGDALMAKATYDVFERLNLRYRPLERSELSALGDMEGRTIVLSGGGNFAEGGYNDYANVLARLHRRAKRIIVLPHTIHGNDDLLSQLGSNVVLFCREMTSFQHAKKRAINANVYLARDMAFLLDVQSVFSFKPRYMRGLIEKVVFKWMGDDRYRAYPTSGAYFRGLRSRMWRSGVEQREDKACNLYRVDIEKTSIELPETNVDASLVFNFGVTSPVKAGFTVFHLFKYLNQFDIINTNRLHLAIAGALLGKRVYLRSNNYFKNRAVFDYSMKNQYPNVVWVDG